MRLTGGLGPAITPRRWKGKPLLSMASTIYGGRPGTPMPGWSAMLTLEEAHWVAQQLAEGFPEESQGTCAMNHPALQPLQRRGLLTLMASAPLWASGCAALADGRAAEATPATLRGTGDLGVVIQRARGAVTVVNTSDRSMLGEITGLGDLSHASVVFSRDGRYAYVFGRDGGLTQVDLLRERIVHRVMQAGNSIGGAVSADGTLVAAQNYVPGGVKVFDAKTLALLADLPATYGNGQRSRVVGLVDLPQRRFAYSLFDADAICIADCSDPTRPRVHTLEGIGRQPYDALVTPDGRHYIAGLFGEDGLAMVDRGNPSPRCGAFWPVTAGASSRCRCTRCRTCAAGQWPGATLTCPPLAATRCWWWTPPPGKRWAASPWRASPCS